MWFFTLAGVLILSCLMLRLIQALRAITSQFSYPNKQIYQTPMMESIPFDVLTTTAAELQSFLSSGKLTSTQIVEVYLAEIEKHNAYLKAVIATAPKSSLLERANALDKERTSGTTRSQLHGLPILVKVSPFLNAVERQ